MIKLFYTIAILCLLTLLLPNSSFGQPGGGDPNGGDKPGEGAVPISGIEILLIGGGAFGVKKLIQRKSKG